MSNYVKLLNNLEELGLHNIKNNLDKYLDLVTSGEKSMTDALYELSNLKNKSQRRKGNIRMCEGSKFSIYKRHRRF